MTFNLFFTQLSSTDIRYRKIPPHLQQVLVNSQNKIRRMFERHPRRERLPAKLARQIFLLDSSGNDYFGKRIPEVLFQLDRMAKKRQIPLTAFRKQEFYFGGVNLVFNKQRYKIYIEQRLSVLSGQFFGVFIREFAHNLLITTFFVSFPLSFLLAWLFTRPIKKLQQTIREMSTNLDNRENLTKLLKRNDEFGDLARDFSTMTDAIKHLIDSKMRLLSDVSHELRSPLARIQIALGLAEKKSSHVKNSELIRIKSEINRIDEMIDGLLDYSRADLLSLENRLDPLDLKPLIESVVNDASFELQSKQIQIILSVDDNLAIIGNASLLISAIENILRNAIRYAKTQIVLTASAQLEEQRMLISIIDDGPGVADDQLDKIFEPFYRPDNARSREHGGAGLGLSIAKKATEAHKGSIKANNHYPNGLEITITLPF
jgi:two-component system, OmpR family, sensor histidine kinase CpxA